jgi:predicted nuclease of restriction endonuclease-like (RecB) superfamily
VSNEIQHIDIEYTEWVAEIKQRYRNAQLKAAVKVNSEKLLFNWLLGADLVLKKAEERWGEGIVEKLSKDLQNEFPNTEGFTIRNLQSMKQWYLFYSSLENEQKLKQAVSQFPNLFAYIGWSHHITIIQKCKDIDEALFYILKTIENNWSREGLKRAIAADIYHKQVSAPNNFTDTLVKPQSGLLQEIVKANYDFSWAEVEHASYDEEELEEALSNNITQMLLELGNGFAFMGRQRELVISGKTRKIDLLFYHIRAHCYVVVELKSKPFEPEFVSKLNFYVSAVNNLIRQSEDNPTVGLLICSDMDETEVRWSFEGLQSPLGVATYSGIKVTELLPTSEQIKQRIKGLKVELAALKRLQERK